MTFKEKRKSPIVFLLIILISMIVGAIGFIYISPAFEQNKPIITVNDSIYWNFKSKLTIKIDDQSGIKYYKITFKDGKRDIELNHNIYSSIEKSITIDVTPPKLDMFYKGENVKLEIEAVDNSKWNFLEGNKIIKEIKVVVDTKKPIANVLSNSRYIQRGGSAAVVVKVDDENLEDAYISFNDLERFELTPYYKTGYFVALLTWPIDIEDFSRVNLIAVDKADNKTITKVPFYIQKKSIKMDKINLSHKFINNISKNVLEQSFEPVPEKLEDIFTYSNKDLRAKNLETIKRVALKAMKNKTIENFNIKDFKRLRGSRTVANFADRRQYFLDGNKINEAWHLGLDFASVKKATIRSSNEGEVIFKDYLGLYGNTIIIDHTMGLSSLYAHTSSQYVIVNDRIKIDQKIAHTGATGAVFGDHLHFGILVQGIEVNPIEWMDKNWIKTRITNILNDAKKQIDGK